MRPGAGFRPVIRQALGGIRQADFSAYKSSLCKRRRRWRGGGKIVPRSRRSRLKRSPATRRSHFKSRRIWRPTARRKCIDPARGRYDGPHALQTGWSRSARAGGGLRPSISAPVGGASVDRCTSSRDYRTSEEWIKTTTPAAALP